MPLMEIRSTKKINFPLWIFSSPSILLAEMVFGDWIATIYKIVVKNIFRVFLYVYNYRNKFKIFLVNDLMLIHARLWFKVWLLGGHYGMIDCHQGFKLWGVKPTTIDFLFAASPLNMQHKRVRAKTGWLGICMCLSGAICLTHRLLFQWVSFIKICDKVCQWLATGRWISINIRKN